MKLSSVLLPLLLGSAAATLGQNRGSRALEDGNDGYYEAVEEEAEEVKYYADADEAEEEAEEVEYYADADEAEEEAEEVEYYADADEAEEEAEEVKYYADADEAEEEAEEVEYYADADGAEEEAEEQADEEEVDESGAFGSDDYYFYDDFFDMSKYSLKVHSCTSIKGINPDELRNNGDGNNGDEDEDDEWANKSTAVINYRLCPTDTCQDDSWQGCRNVYGNYMVSVKEFLENKYQGKDEKQDELCEKCDWCVWAKDTLYYECNIYEECQNVSCDDEEDEENDKEEEIQYHEFAECTAVDIYVEEEEDDQGGRRKLDEDANLVYLQIYCDGGSTLKLGLFSDEDCANYIGDQYDISEITGLNITEYDLENELVSDCVSCRQSDDKYYIPEYDEDAWENQDEENDSKDEEEVAEICEKIYEESLKCNEYIPFNETAYYDQAEEWAETTNNVTCAFLEAMQKEAGQGVVNMGYDNGWKDESFNTFSDLKNNVTVAHVFGGAVALVAVGAALAANKDKTSKKIGEDLDTAFVAPGGETA